MRTSTPAATAAPAAPASAGKPATIPPDTRRAAILVKIDKLAYRDGLIVVPPSIDTMAFGQIIGLAEDIFSLKRMARSKASLRTVLRVAGRVAAAYGVDMATIDPCHGSAA